MNDAHSDGERDRRRLPAGGSDRARGSDRAERARRAAAARLAPALAAAALVTSACQPRVVVEAPKDPIVINMNIKIEHEIRVKVDKDLDQLFANEKDVF
jgi:hypothetical protein